MVARNWTLAVFNFLKNIDLFFKSKLRWTCGRLWLGHMLPINVDIRKYWWRALFLNNWNHMMLFLTKYIGRANWVGYSNRVVTKFIVFFFFVGGLELISLHSPFPFSAKLQNRMVSYLYPSYPPSCPYFPSFSPCYFRDLAGNTE